MRGMPGRKRSEEICWKCVCGCLLRVCVVRQPAWCWWLGERACATGFVNKRLCKCELFVIIFVWQWCMTVCLSDWECVYVTVWLYVCIPYDWGFAYDCEIDVRQCSCDRMFGRPCATLRLCIMCITGVYLWLWGVDKCWCEKVFVPACFLDLELKFVFFWLSDWMTVCATRGTVGPCVCRFHDCVKRVKVLLWKDVLGYMCPWQGVWMCLSDCVCALCMIGFCLRLGCLTM